MEGKKIDEATAPVVGSFMDSLQGIFVAIQDAMEQVPITEKVQLRMAKLADILSLSANPGVVTVNQKIVNRWINYPADITRSLHTMAMNGWYFDNPMPSNDLFEFDRLFTNGDRAKAEALLVTHFENRLEQICKEIVKEFPDRTGPVGAAFRAHKAGEYYLSIPVLLIHADGMMLERLKKSWMNRYQDAATNTAKAQTKPHVEDQVALDTIASYFLDPIQHVYPINAGPKQRGADFKGLNRHLVVHGEDSNYASHINSLKAISLINYSLYVVSAGNETVG